jgi:uncharacterized membrane protein
MACHFEAARKLIDTIVRPITGVAPAALMGFPLTSNWLMLSITLYLSAASTGFRDGRRARA